MGIGYKYLFLITLCVILCSCIQGEPGPDYGEEYFQMECVWADPNDGSIMWRCSEEVKTDLVSGYLLLQLEGTTDLYFCGEKLLLQSEVGIYDNLISYLTRDKFECLHITEDKKKGNQFDWIWRAPDKLLQIIWRPVTKTHKMISLIIEEGEYYEPVPGMVYYKTLEEE